MPTLVRANHRRKTKQCQPAMQECSGRLRGRRLPERDPLQVPGRSADCCQDIFVSITVREWANDIHDDMAEPAIRNLEMTSIDQFPPCLGFFTGVAALAKQLDVILHCWPIIVGCYPGYRGFFAKMVHGVKRGKDLLP